MNKVLLTGNLCRDVQVNQTSTGKEYLNNVIAVQRDFKNAQGNYESDFISLAAWGSQAVYMGEYAKKGDRLEIVGRWQVERYEDVDGETKTVNKCIVESVKIISKAKEQQAERPVLTELPDTGLPF